MHRWAHINSKNSGIFIHATVGDENSERESNPTPYPAFTYLPGSGFLANLTPLNKQSFKVKSELKSREHASNS